jgi:hypothetical protein
MTSNEGDLDLKAETERILAVKDIHEDDLLSKANVVGVAIGFRQKNGQSTDTLALVVMVSSKVPQSALSPEDQIPVSIDGIPIDVQEIGEISAL